MLGLTNKQIAEAFDIGESTFDRWIAEHDELAEQLRAGRIDADAEVAHSLYKRAIGYSHKAEKAFQYEGQVITHRYTEHYPPDVQAATKWLHNRKPDLWRPVREPEEGDTAATPVRVVVEVKDGRVRAEPESTSG